MAVRGQVRQPHRLRFALFRSRSLQRPSSPGEHQRTRTLRGLRPRRSTQRVPQGPRSDWAERLVEHAKRAAAKLGRTYLYRTGTFRKDQWAEGLLREQRIESGLVGVLCTLETCNSFDLVRAPERPRFVSRPRQQRVLYWYFLDRDLGLIHVRLQTWAPFTLQICVNGHDWLAQQLARRQAGFVLKNNAFVQIDEPAKAQRLADRFAGLGWPKILDRYAHRVNPLLRKGQPLERCRPRWVVDQAEFATDLLFESPESLADLYARLLAFASLTFSPKDILSFLGRKLSRRFDGDVQTERKEDRVVGTRLKHRMTRNWLKMYDKFGRILRVETVINRPREFSVYRTRHHRDGTSSSGWFPMTKDTANLIHYRDQALAANRRYLDALAVVDDPAPPYRQLRQLTEPKTTAGRSAAGFNPARREDVRLFRAVLDGDHIARGFRNKDIREALFGPDAKHRKQNARRSAAVGRLVKRLHVRALVAKIPRTRRWRVTDEGRRMLNSAVRLYHQTWPELAAA